MLPQMTFVAPHASLIGKPIWLWCRLWSPATTVTSTIPSILLGAPPPTPSCSPRFTHVQRAPRRDHRSFPLSPVSEDVKLYPVADVGILSACCCSNYEVEMLLDEVKRDEEERKGY